MEVRVGSWEADLSRRLQDLTTSEEWHARLAECGRGLRSVHLAVFVEPFLGYILEGRKSVESRFSKRPVPPYGTVRPKDILVLKRAAGPAVAVCEVGAVWRYVLDSEVVQQLRREFSAALCAMDPAFWESRAEARFLTLMRIQDVMPISPIRVAKRDRRGWVTLDASAARQLALE